MMQVMPMPCCGATPPEHTAEVLTQGLGEIVCDESNNSPEDVAAGRIVADVSVIVTDATDRSGFGWDPETGLCRACGASKGPWCCDNKACTATLDVLGRFCAACEAAYGMGRAAVVIARAAATLGRTEERLDVLERRVAVLEGQPTTTASRDMSDPVVRYGGAPHGDYASCPAQARFVMAFSDERGEGLSSDETKAFVGGLRQVAADFGYDVATWGTDEQMTDILVRCRDLERASLHLGNIRWLPPGQGGSTGVSVARVVDVSEMVSSGRVVVPTWRATAQLYPTHEFVNDDFGTRDEAVDYVRDRLHERNLVELPLHGFVHDVEVRQTRLVRS